MKLIYYFSILLYINCFVSHAQHSKVIIEYEGMYYVDVESELKRAPEKFHDMMRQIFSNIKPVDFTLLIDENESIFFQIESIDLENEPLNYSSLIGQKGPFYINTKIKRKRCVG